MQHIRILKPTSRSPLSLPNIRKNFENLSVDPYVREGFRRKHIRRYRVLSKEHDLVLLQPLPNEPLFQRKLFNPVHGDIQRNYPIFKPTWDTMKVIHAFVRESDVVEGQRILVQAQRIVCTPNMIGLPSVEDWHQDDVTEIGIFCVTRKNVLGGMNQFQELSSDKIASSFVLQEGELALFKDAFVRHRVTPIAYDPIDDKSCDGHGYRDVLLLSHGGCT